MECAQALAPPDIEEGGKTDDESITYAFRRVARPPATRKR